MEKLKRLFDVEGLGRERLAEMRGMSRISMSAGILLLVVPLGVILLNMVVAQDGMVNELKRLGWTLWVTLGLIPCGVSLCVSTLIWRQKILIRELELEDEENVTAVHDAHEQDESRSGNGRPDLTPPPL